MSGDKEEYIESVVSLEGKYPSFEVTGDAQADILVRFEKEGPVKVVHAAEAKEDIGGDLELHFAEHSGKLAALRFAGAAQRWKLERCVSISLFP